MMKAGRGARREVVEQGVGLVFAGSGGLSGQELAVASEDGARIFQGFSPSPSPAVVTCQGEDLRVHSRAIATSLKPLD